MCSGNETRVKKMYFCMAKRCLAAHGIPVERHSARQINLADYEKFDRIVCMEKYNLRNLPKITDKVQLLLDRDIADPWYTGDFETTYRDLEEGLRGLI